MFEVSKSEVLEKKEKEESFRAAIKHFHLKKWMATQIKAK